MPISSSRKKKNKSLKPSAKPNSLELKQTHKGNNNSLEQSYYQGIVPSPEMMEKYKIVSESLPDRLVKLTEDEALHRRFIEKKIVNQNFASIITGQIFALLAVGGIAFLSYIFMVNGNASEGKTIAVSVTIGLAAIFLGRRIIVKNSTEK
jgi:uncharacterized membrane protein